MEQTAVGKQRLNGFLFCCSIIHLGPVFAHLVKLYCQKGWTPRYWEFNQRMFREILLPFPLFLTTISLYYTLLKFPGFWEMDRRFLFCFSIKVNSSSSWICQRNKMNGQIKYPYVDKGRKENIPQTVVMEINRSCWLYPWKPCFCSWEGAPLSCLVLLHGISCQIVLPCPHFPRQNLKWVWESRLSLGYTFHMSYNC